MTQETWFVFNPISGVLSPSRKQALLRFIEAQPGARLVFTQRAGHGTELASQAAREGVRAVVAIGGDGTVNEVARGLLGSQVALGIVPVGSGNGLARQLRLPLGIDASVRFALQPVEPQAMDVGFLNDVPFFCTAGLGFDAWVAHAYARRAGRGLTTYVRATARTLWQYRPERCRFLTSGPDGTVAQPEEVDVFSLTFANAGQYGNDAWIAPEARLDDGLLDVALLRPFPKTHAIVMSRRLFRGQLATSPYYSLRRGREFRIETDAPLLLHYDGEPLVLPETSLHVRLQPGALRVLAPAFGRGRRAASR